MAKQQSSQGAVDLTTAYKSFFFDLPMASLKWGLGMGEEKDTTIAAWKGYDASVRMATAAIDSLYRNPLFGNVFGRTAATLLQWQKISSAVSGAMFTSLWKTMGVPTVDEVQGLSEQLRNLENHLSRMAQEKDVKTLLEQVRALEARLARPAPVVMHSKNGHEEARVAA